MATPPLSIRQGSCLCKGVQYELSGEPLEIRVCHCVNCRKATGSAFMVNSFWGNENFKITQGASLLRTYTDHDTATQVPINRHFCGTCGSNVYLASTHPKNRWVVVGLGTIDAKDERCLNWVPTKEWFAEQRRPWIAGIDTLEQRRQTGEAERKARF